MSDILPGVEYRADPDDLLMTMLAWSTAEVLERLFPHVLALLDIELMLGGYQTMLLISEDETNIMLGIDEYHEWKLARVMDSYAPEIMYS